jgi:hypothetical protein
MPFLLDTTALYASLQELQIVEKILQTAELPFPIKFLGTSDSFLAFHIDNLDDYPAQTIQAMLDTIAKTLGYSSDPIVQGLIERTDRIGII